MEVAAAVFGIAKYNNLNQDGGLSNLQFAGRDAEAFARYINAAWSNSAISDVRCFIDETATEARWNATVDSISQAKPDLFLVYLAGHAVESSDSGFVFCLSLIHI